MTKALLRTALLGLLLSIVLAGVLMLRLNSTRVIEGTDAPQYDHYATTVADDRGFSSWGGPPFRPTIYREPLYPLLVATFYSSFGPDADLVALAQVSLVALIAGLTFVIGNRLFGPYVGLIAAALCGLSPSFLYSASSLLSEVLFSFLLTVSMVLALNALRSGERRDHVLVGLGLGLAILVRVIAGALVVPILLVLALGGQTSPQRRERWFVRPALILLGTAVVVTPWLIRNWAAVGNVALTSRSGVVVIRRAPKAAEPIEAYATWLQSAAWVATNPISHLIVPISRFQRGPRPEDNQIWDFHVNDSVRLQDRYDSVCQASPDWDECANAVGAAFFRKYPLQYLVQAGFEFVKLHFAPLPGIQALVHNVTIWLAFGTGVWLVVRRRLNAGRCLLLIPLALYVGVSILVDTQVRYILPLLPIYAVLAAAPLARLGRWLVARDKWDVRNRPL